MPAAVLEGGVGQCNRDGRLRTRAASSIREGDEVEIVAEGRRLSGPVRLANGLAPGVLRITLGYGRTRAGRIGNGLGIDAAVLRSSASPWITRGAALRRVSADGRLSPAVAGLYALPGEARKLAPELAPGAALPPPAPKPSFNTPTPTPPGDPYAWAMSIDTDACIGCNACVVACQSENNVPSIGPDQIRMGRDMHWLRIDVYDHGDAQEPRPVFQPVPCMHCETAPCEPVCPVEASVHDHEGLNVQVYNRCVGTRFCESNCPYKVRRFNFFGYADGQEYGDLGDPLVKAANNPNVSVRARGVMEKCTYCVQRISAARRLAERETRLIAEGRGRHRLSGRLSDAGDPLRQSGRPEIDRLGAAPRPAPLHAARGTAYAAAHDLSRAGAKRRP